MTNPAGARGHSLEIRRTFQAPREKVYAAWTQREKLEQWMCRDVPTHEARYVELDVRPGGRYVIEIALPEGGKYVGKGTFLEVIPPEKLVFTWAWWRVSNQGEEPLHAQESVVTIKLLEQGASTEMVFSHELIESAKLRDDHQKGWEGCFKVLANILDR